MVDVLTTSPIFQTGLRRPLARQRNDPESEIHAIIFDGDPATAAVPDGSRTVPLSLGLTMLPLTGDLLDHLPSLRPGDEPISANLAALRRDAAGLARLISSDRQALYIFGETWAGPGRQEAVGFQAGRQFYSPVGTCDLEVDREPGYLVVPHENSAINAGLRAMGVKAAPGVDEYETTGLSRHRRTEDWIKA
jgi:hypothetical protein